MGRGMSSVPLSAPYLLRVIDESDPDGSAVIGAISPDLRNQIKLNTMI